MTHISYNLLYKIIFYYKYIKIFFGKPFSIFQYLEHCFTPTIQSYKTQEKIVMFCVYC